MATSMVDGLGANESPRASLTTKISWPTRSGSEAGGATSGGPSAPARRADQQEDGGGITPVQMSTASRRDEMMADMMAQIAEQRATLEALMRAQTGKVTSVRVVTPTNVSNESGHLGAVEV